MSKPRAQPASNILLVKVPPQFIALCEASGASPQAALLFGLQYDIHKRLVLLEGTSA